MGIIPRTTGGGFKGGIGLLSRKASGVSSVVQAARLHRFRFAGSVQASRLHYGNRAVVIFGRGGIFMSWPK